LNQSGNVKDRRELKRALEMCRKEKATLLIAKLDRLARNAAFLLNLQDSGVKFTAVDMPFADNFTVGILALVAQTERELISERTKAGLAAAKRRGKRLPGRSTMIVSPPMLHFGAAALRLNAVKAKAGARCRFRTCNSQFPELPVEGISLPFIAHRVADKIKCCQYDLRFDGQIAARNHVQNSCKSSRCANSVQN
jgi:hypothetical protein